MNRLETRLDQVDRQLIAMLRHNARRSTASLARDLNLSRTAVQARLARLEADGVILGYSTLVATGRDTETAALVRLAINVRPCDLVIEHLVSLAEVERIFSIAGDWDIALIVRTTSPRALSGLTDRLHTVPGVHAVETTVILSERQKEPGPGRSIADTGIASAG